LIVSSSVAAVMGCPLGLLDRSREAAVAQVSAVLSDGVLSSNRCRKLVLFSEESGFSRDLSVSD